MNLFFSLLTLAVFYAILFAIFYDGQRHVYLQQKCYFYLGIACLGLAIALPWCSTYLFHRAFNFLVKSLHCRCEKLGNAIIIRIPGKVGILCHA